MRSGNAVVLKCSEQVAWSSRFFIGAVRDCLAACGHDPDLVQVCAASACRHYQWPSFLPDGLTLTGLCLYSSSSATPSRRAL